MVIAEVFIEPLNGLGLLAILAFRLDLGVLVGPGNLAFGPVGRPDNTPSKQRHVIADMQECLVDPLGIKRSYQRAFNQFRSCPWHWPAIRKARLADRNGRPRVDRRLEHFQVGKQHLHLSSAVLLGQTLQAGIVFLRPLAAFVPRGESLVCIQNKIAPHLRAHVWRVGVLRKRVVIGFGHTLRRVPFGLVGGPCRRTAPGFAGSFVSVARMKCLPRLTAYSPKASAP